MPSRLRMDLHVASRQARPNVVSAHALEWEAGTARPSGAPGLSSHGDDEVQQGCTGSMVLLRLSSATGSLLTHVQQTKPLRARENRDVPDIAGKRRVACDSRALSQPLRKEKSPPPCCCRVMTVGILRRCVHPSIQSMCARHTPCAVCASSRSRSRHHCHCARPPDAAGLFRVSSSRERRKCMP